MNTDLTKMCNLEYVLGRTYALQDLAGCARQTMAMYAIGCNHPDYAPDSDVAIAVEYYRKKLKEIENQIREETRDLFDDMFPNGNKLAAHLNTLQLVWGFNSIFKTIIRDMLVDIDGFFIDIGSDDQRDTRQRVIKILDNIEHELKDYDALVEELKEKAERKLVELKDVM